MSYRTDQQREAGLAKTIDALQNVFDLASDSYRQGIASFIDAGRPASACSAPNSSGRRRKRRARLTLCSAKALGGGWEPYQQVRLPDYSVFGDAPRG